MTIEIEKVEEYLKIRKNRIEDRKEEIEKQKVQAVNANARIIEKMIAC